MHTADHGRRPRGVPVLRLLSVLEARVGALVHPAAVALQTTEVRHRAFIRHKLVMSGIAVALTPVYLAVQRPPSAAEALFLVCLLLPLAGLAIVARLGQLHLAQCVCVVGIVGLAAIPSLAGWAGGRGALFWLLVLPFEAALAVGVALAAWAGAAAALALVVLLASTSATEGWLVESLFSLSGLAYATFLAYDINEMLVALRGSARRNATEFHALTETVGDLLLHVDRSGLVASLSGSDDHLLGLRRADLLDRGFFERLHVGDRPAFLKAVSDAALGAATNVVTLRLRSVDAKLARGVDEPVFRWIELRLHGDGVAAAQPGVLAVLRDVTEGKLHEQATEAARKAAEDASLSKDHFLANVSHELRTPLNAIIGFSEMMCSAQIGPISPDKQREYAEIIHQSGHHLLSVVNSLLDMSKIRAGSFELLPEPFAVAPLVDLCCDMVKLKAEDGGVELVRAYPERLDELVGDKRACKQIVINLLSNAVKFTPSGGRVTIGAKPDGNHLILQVTDTGIGIHSGDLGRLGDAFFQARTGVDRPFEGTGLGLSVVRGLVGLHGGTIKVESEPGQGTAVTVRLPLDCASHLAARGSAAIETLPRRSRMDDIGLSRNMRVRKVA